MREQPELRERDRRSHLVQGQPAQHRQNEHERRESQEPAASRVARVGAELLLQHERQEIPHAYTLKASIPTDLMKSFSSVSPLRMSSSMLPCATTFPRFTIESLLHSLSAISSRWEAMNTVPPLEASSSRY